MNFKSKSLLPTPCLENSELNTKPKVRDYNYNNTCQTETGEIFNPPLLIQENQGVSF
jgi:hypothetical protein